MKKNQNRSRKDRGIPLFVFIIIVFGMLGVIVFSVAGKLSAEMSASAIQNLSESLNLIQCTIEAILKNEADFQKLIAQRVAAADNPIEYICVYERNETMVKLSLILEG